MSIVVSRFYNASEYCDTECCGTGIVTLVTEIKLISVEVGDIPVVVKRSLYQKYNIL